MKILFSLGLAVSLFAGGWLQAAAVGDPKAELKALTEKIQVKLQEGKKAETNFTAELKEFDTLLAKHKGEKGDDVAQIAFLKALMYIQIFEDSDKGMAMIKDLKTQFPGSTQAQNADQTLAAVQSEAEGRKIQKSMVEGSAFPDFDAKDVSGKSISVAGFKGKVVLVDFWATWCGPCVAELPHVKSAYQKYHDKGFEIIGVSLDDDAGKLKAFTEKENMPWQQYFDGKMWDNKLAVKYGVRSIPATILIDGVGNIIARDLRGPDLEAALAKALSK